MGVSPPTNVALYVRACVVDVNLLSLYLHVRACLYVSAFVWEHTLHANVAIMTTKVYAVTSKRYYSLISWPFTSNFIFSGALPGNTATTIYSHTLAVTDRAKSTKCTMENHSNKRNHIFSLI